MNLCLELNLAELARLAFTATNGKLTAFDGAVAITAKKLKR